MGWVVAIGLAVLVALAVIGLGRLPRASWELVGAALLLGLAGYAWQGSSALSGSPHAAGKRDVRFDEKLVERRRALADRLGPANQWLILSDGLGRQGKSREAANVLVSGLRQYPDDANLWLGLGNALLVHGEGVLSPGADFAYRRALQLGGKGPGPAYFYGLALAAAGQYGAARDQWVPLHDRLPPQSGLRRDLEEKIGALNAIIAAQDGTTETGGENPSLPETGQAPAR